jgi:hypothetical protein
MNTEPGYRYVPPEVIAEENYIREGIEKYGYDGFWKMVEELNQKYPPKPAYIPLIRRQFPNLKNVNVK